MQLLNALYKQKNSGFTLLEITVIVLIIALLGAIVSPSFLNLYNVNKVNEGIDKTKGAIQEAQNQAIRYGKQCQIKVLNQGENTKYGTAAKFPTVESIDVATPNNKGQESCLINGDRVFAGLELKKTNPASPWIVSFDSKGRTNVDSAGTIVLSVSGVPKPEKCIVLSEGLGLIRSGDYDPTKPTEEERCQTSR
jgi:type II secretory pathway pseudopilin PulG